MLFAVCCCFCIQKVANWFFLIQRSPTVVLNLKKPEPDKKVSWDESSAVDNEHMNKKKSKCL
jgi:hypothetical protein